MNQDEPLNDQNHEIERTFIEGAGGDTGFPPRSDTFVDAQTSTPYTQSGAGADGLPSGDEPLPIGSGIIAGVLGSGGMARIYKIWNEKLEVYRAVKILFPNQQKDLQSRFETEAKITAKLHHPNIVEIYNVGEWSALPFLEMELIDGESLDRVIHRIGRMPPAVCSAIGIFVARALTYAHQQQFLIYGKTYNGIIHRDLKPANIMISRSGEIKLMDFGIARPTETSLHTVEGNIVGTLQYLSPEQMDGVGIDRRTDIYSFGAILYEMLTGTKTFPQNTITNLMKMKAMNRYRRFDEFKVALPQALIKIAQKCLAVDKEDRYTDAEELLHALERAHRQITQNTPEQTLKKYVEDPDEFDMGGARLFALPRWAKIAAPAAAVVLIIAGIFLYFGGTAEDETPIASSVSTSASDQSSQPQKAPGKAEAEQDGSDANPPASASDAQRSRPAPPPKPRPAPKPASRPRRRPAVSKPAAPASQPSPQEQSPVDKLKEKYSENDMIAIAETALRRGEHSDALTALNNLESARATSTKATLLFLEAYVGSGQTAKAREILRRSTINDAWYYVLAGRVEEQSGSDKKALEQYQTALTKPSQMRTRIQIRNDALYYTALILDNYYRIAPSQDTRLQALNAWKNLKRCYTGNPDHPRFKMANKKLATIN
jgi:serine/threonine protein kinase